MNESKLQSIIVEAIKKQYPSAEVTALPGESFGRGVEEYVVLVEYRKKRPFAIVITQEED